MLENTDFSKKQIVFVFASEGEKISFSNENLIVKKEDINTKSDKKTEKIKFQISLYRLFIVYIIGDLSLTTVIINKTRKYGFFIVLMSSSFRINNIIGALKEGNTLLHERQYIYNGIEIAKHIVKNKIINQRETLNKIRNKSKELQDAITKLDSFRIKVDDVLKTQELLSIEGNCAKIYFMNLFSTLPWKGRKPRIKGDYINATLDIGYTLLFSFIDSIISCYGFDTYKGVYHTQFYMRKSLICDLIEPFRCLVDWQIRKACNLGQITEEDFFINNHQYKLKWENSKKYVSFLINPILQEKEEIFKFLQFYYRAFMKGKKIEEYPIYRV